MKTHVIHSTSILLIISPVLVIVNAACDFSRLEMENCFIEYYSSADSSAETDPICGAPPARLARVKLCVKVWEKVFLKPAHYLRPRDTPHLGHILTPESDWNFKNECVHRRIRFLSADINHEDMVAGVFECPMRELQFDRFETISNFYVSYGGEPNSVFYFHELKENLALAPQVDETGTIVLKIEHWISHLDRIPDLSRGQLMWTIIVPRVPTSLVVSNRFKSRNRRPRGL